MKEHLRSAAELGVVNVLDVVTRLFGLEGAQRGEELDMLCPDPAHEDRRPSASVNLITGYWHCFSCGRGGDLIKLGARVLEKHPTDIEDMLKPDSVDALRVLLRTKMPIRNRRTERKPMPVPSDYRNGPLDELLDRGFTKQTLRRWDVRFVEEQVLDGQQGPFTIRNSIGIPVMDANRMVLSWCYRRTGQSPQWQPRYLYPGGTDMIKDTWFGLQHHARADQILVVEGALDAIWCDQAGMPALALLGATMGDRKLERLIDYPSVVLLGDCDAAGMRWVRRVGQTIGSLTGVRVATYASWMTAKDPQELDPVELEVVVEKSVPWAAWCVSERKS